MNPDQAGAYARLLAWLHAELTGNKFFNQENKP